VRARYDQAQLTRTNSEKDAKLLRPSGVPQSHLPSTPRGRRTLLVPPDQAARRASVPPPARPCSGAARGKLS